MGNRKNSPYNTLKIVSLEVTAISYAKALEEVINLATSRQPSYICFANSHMTVEATTDPGFARMVNNATLVLPDGIPVKVAMNHLYKVKQERISGMDFLPDLMGEANKKKLDVFIFGSTLTVVRALENKLSSFYARVKLAGFIIPPFNKDWNNQEYVKEIQQADPHLVLVALGCPKQEKWMAEYSQQINAVLLGIGGALPVLAGVKKNAPAWMKKNGLEWLYRLLQEPKRLWKRYLITNSLMLWYLIRQFTFRNK